jgi:integrase
VSEAITFEKAGRAWERTLATTIRRNGRPLSANTRRIYSGNLNRLIENIGAEPLPVSNRVLKDYIARMRAEYSASQIVGDLAVVKLVCESVTDDDGNCLYPLKIKHDFCATPILNPEEQNAPCATREQVEGALSGPRDVAVLVAICAGAGLRISEALALSIEDDGNNDVWDMDGVAIHIRRTVKTPASARTVYLCTELNDFLVDQFRGSTHARMFPASRSEIYRLLDKLSLPPCHAYRRFRVTVCRKAGMNEEVLKRLIGHSRGNSVTTRYDRTRDDIDFIRSEVERVGLAFTLGGGLA